MLVSVCAKTNEIAKKMGSKVIFLLKNLEV